MRLTHIKLAGFKSFVDPTTIVTSGQLVAVCGPNGCGKSNVIDAVRWVLGESSAKQLRGESMQDVIFNGSTSRKSVSRASVELVFNNDAGLAAGQWSQYAEISIKRVLTRQGESSYYINNLQVRRRDITDLFLGTGVGKGGYAIIEQGMISRIIEAKPEELRHYLEEAAGVSKYKERRRETENRLADTRDNLSRVDDIRLELDGQIERLSTQAEVAAEFHRLKEAVTEKQNLLALQRKLDAAKDAEQAKREIEAAQNALEGKISELRSLEAEIEALREAHYAASDTVHSAQGELYEANAAVARLEQQLLHLRQTRERLGAQVAEIKAEMGRVDQELANATGDRYDWLARREEAAILNEDAALQLSEESDRLPELEALLKAADGASQDLRDRQAGARKAAELAAQQLQHHERTLTALQLRRGRLEAELRETAGADDTALQMFAEQVEENRLLAEERTLALADDEAALEMARAVQADAQTAREALRLEQAGLLAREQALARLAAPHDEQALQDWFVAQGLRDMPRLLESLSIEPGWAAAVEAALGQRLQARLAQGLPQENAPGPAALALAGVLAAPVPGEIAGCPPLLVQLRCREPGFLPALQDWLALVWCAPEGTDLAAASNALPAGGWLVTQAGVLLGRHGVHYHAAGSALSGVLERQQELADVRTRLEILAPQLEIAEAQVMQTRSARESREAVLRVARMSLQQAREQLAQQEKELARKQEAAGQAARRRNEAQEELVLLDEQISDETLGREECQAALSQAQEEYAPLAAALDSAQRQRQSAEQDCELQRTRLRQRERAAQEARFAVQNAEARLLELERRTCELAERRDLLAERLENAILDLDSVDEGDFDIGFQDAVDRRSEKERLLAVARDALNGAQNGLREREATKQVLDATLEPARESVNVLRLKEQEARLAVERFAQELAEAEVDEEALRHKLGTGLKISTLVAEIGRLTQAVNGLGAVNLAALEELTAARERKDYLDRQEADLRTAMETLESAIRRIDRETRALLSETFHAVNASLQELFPALFGGGHAELSLTGEEILDAGLQIMAQPPGKKNSTIHLLSGGEKALTALSLVFSLFRLNPAPFCLLDEVDAPLDDANTLRYCDLVKKMAERTQFLFISHNRLAMEMAQQLVGVTMQEQGVSRVVAVDIEQALSMREAVPV
ncbi:MAG: chromosome segregation protein [Proteobacteria bacterium]|nr:chromosome segregation protein [Pseudomonadota bacterium]